jgi:hypothetical protein
MTPNEFLCETRPAASRVVRRGSPAASLLSVNQRLAKAEGELRIQFTRIAQLQAQLDSVMAALRRSPDGAHVRASVGRDS